MANIALVTEKEVFRYVYDKLTEIPLFIGIYDAKNGSEDYEYGIETVMEVLADRAGCYDEYQKLVLDNIVSSKKRAERKEE